jgi:hypothetical protein
MKNFMLFILMGILLCACTGQDMEMSEAKKTAETAINLIGGGEFDKLSEMYSTDFGASEPKEVRLQKFTQIIEATGPVQSFELKDSVAANEIGEESRITLTYNVKHSKLNTVETYKISKESGNYVIAGINIQLAD